MLFSADNKSEDYVNIQNELINDNIELRTNS